MDIIKKKNMSKIDFHVHYLPKAYKEVMLKYCGERPDDFPTPDWDAESHLEAMDCLGISTSMLSLSSPHINFGNYFQIDSGRASTRKMLCVYSQDCYNLINL
ncbi:hypothetical protein SAMN02745136_05207 [Anaerocolumna jejuensis DSM 15929]|uniref:Amidohydrolase n=1 Tax=Anaerocolumna jejuensis DSM 15929 TaxID=1121322 RepID=A0A1M7BPX8_9FIRM|nr:hypothetical protein [Anaerocolumna jejuensis]SHL57108.1 hypothetical protein SAMN02745136_05207 [Anaerocolumna jejuensis DSM 15929]